MTAFSSLEILRYVFGGNGLAGVSLEMLRNGLFEEQLKLASQTAPNHLEDKHYPSCVPMIKKTLPIGAAIPASPLEPKDIPAPDKEEEKGEKSSITPQGTSWRQIQATPSETTPSYSLSTPEEAETLHSERKEQTPPDEQIFDRPAYQLIGVETVGAESGEIVSTRGTEVGKSLPRSRLESPLGSPEANPAPTETTPPDTEILGEFSRVNSELPLSPKQPTGPESETPSQGMGLPIPGDQSVGVGTTESGSGQGSFGEGAVSSGPADENNSERLVGEATEATLGRRRAPENELTSVFQEASSRSTREQTSKEQPLLAAGAPAIQPVIGSETSLGGIVVSGAGEVMPVALGYQPTASGTETGQKATGESLQAAQIDSTAKTTEESRQVGSISTTGSVARGSSSKEFISGKPGVESSSQEANVQRVRFIQRVVRAFQSLREGGGPLRLRLHPPELGSLRLELTVQEGVLRARMEVENAAARSAILEHLPILRERLAQQDIRIEQFEVEIGQDSSGPNSQQPEHSPSEQRTPAFSTPNNRSRRPEAVSPPNRGNPLAASDSSKLNVVI